MARPHPRVTFHCTPPSASWVNAIEGLFAKLTKQRLRRGVFHSIVALQEAINRYVAQTNDDPRPFRWTKDPDKIIAAVRRGHQVLESLHWGRRADKLRGDRTGEKVGRSRYVKAQTALMIDQVARS